MLVIEVDVIDTETSKAPFAGTADVVRLAINVASFRIIRITHKAELCRQHDFVPSSFDGFADELLVLERAIHVCGIEQRHAEIESAMDSRDGFALVTGAIKFRHAHAAQAERRNAQAAFSQFTCFHNFIYAMVKS